MLFRMKRLLSSQVSPKNVVSATTVMSVLLQVLSLQSVLLAPQALPQFEAAFQGKYALVRGFNEFSCHKYVSYFQGECRKSSPCHQMCFDLHDGTFECACHEGFHLQLDGYSCSLGKFHSYHKRTLSPKHSHFSQKPLQSALSIITNPSLRGIHLL